MTPTEPPRRPKPITREHAEELAKRWHGATLDVEGRGVPSWDDLDEARRNGLTQVAYELLDDGEVIALDHREAHAVTELLANVDVGVDEADAAPLDNAFKDDLVGAFRKLAFASGRQYGLSNFDMGIEEEPT